MLEKRKFFQSLNDRGYNVIRLPRSGLMPLDVLGRAKGEVARLGRVDELLLEQPDSIPTATIEDAVGFGDLSTGGVGGEAGVNLLQGLLERLGKGRIGLDGSWSSAHRVELRYDALTVSSMSMAVASRLISRCGLDADGPLLRAYLSGPRRSVYLISEVLYSGAFSIHLSRETRGGGAVDVPLAELGVEAGGELEATGDRSAQMRYTGARPMAIGFRCFEVKIDRQGRLELENTDVGGPVFFSDDDDAPQGALLVEDDWLDL